MLRTSVLCAFAVAAMAQISIPPGFAPSFPGGGRQIESGSGSLTSGVRVRYTTVVTPASASRGSWGEGWVSMDGDTVHRGMVDRGSGSYFGYDLTIVAGDVAGSFVATFGPLSKVKPDIRASLEPLAPPKLPVRRVVADGDTIEVDLIVSPDGTRKLTDYIEIFVQSAEPAVVPITAEPRDFTIDDGPVTFNAVRPAVWINGRMIERVAFTGRPGATFWIAVPDQGRYVLSLVPHEGFTKSGVVRGNVVSFQSGGQRFEVRTLSFIAGRGHAWNLYVLHDAAYEPAPYQRDMVRIGTDRLENLLPKR